MHNNILIIIFAIYVPIFLVTVILTIRRYWVLKRKYIIEKKDRNNKKDNGW